VEIPDTKDINPLERFTLLVVEDIAIVVGVRGASR
jgi:hypothetical protein